MNENYTDEVKAIIEAAQQQALMNYNQEVTSAISCWHCAAMTSSSFCCRHLK